MIKWTKRTDGTFEFDYTDMDYWIELNMKHGIDRQINFQSLVGVVWCFVYFDEATGKVTNTGAGGVGSNEWNKICRIFLTDLIAHLEEKGLSFDREAVITRCVELKRDVVMEDEFDTGARMKLNLGHTVGHGVEAKSHFAISHGKAVAIGMAIVSRASACADTPRIVALLEQFGLPTRTDYSADDLFTYTLSDKKRSGGTVNLIIPRAIGDCAIVPTKVESLKSFIQAGL